MYSTATHTGVTTDLLQLYNNGPHLIFTFILEQRYITISSFAALHVTQVTHCTVPRSSPAEAHSRNQSFRWWFPAQTYITSPTVGDYPWKLAHVTSPTTADYPQKLAHVTSPTASDYPHAQNLAHITSPTVGDYPWKIAHVTSPKAGDYPRNQ